MIYAKIKDAEERERLKEALVTTKDKRMYSRLLIISLSSEGYQVKRLSEMFNVCKATIRTYIKSYSEGGLKGLAPIKQPGRPVKIGHWTKGDWDKVLEQTPSGYEKLSSRSRVWTLDLLRKYVKQYHGIDVCISSIHDSLKKTGRRTGRSKLRVGSPDPEYIAKRQHTKGVQNLP